jgi:inward rectifier potassium channel
MQEQNSDSMESEPLIHNASHLVNVEVEMSAQHSSSLPLLVDRSNGGDWAMVEHRGSALAYLYWYLKDPYHSLVHTKWWRILLVFFLLNVALYMAFALVYFRAEQCVGNLLSFGDAVYFSVATAATIGYGHRYPLSGEGNCGYLSSVVIVEVFVSLMLDSAFLGVVFARLSLASNIRTTVVFSSTAAATTRDGQPFLLMQVGNIRKTQLIETHARLVVVRHRRTAEGERIVDYPTMNLMIGDRNVKLGDETELVMFALPLTLAHPIDETSPLYGHTEESWHRDGLEIVLVIEGICASTSNTVQAVYSYPPATVRWGRRFVDIISSRDDGRYHVDFERLGETVPAPCPAAAQCPTVVGEDERDESTDDDDDHIREAME